MSIKIMTRVWEYSKQGGSQLLLLLAIADNANDNGGYAWPSQETLAKKIRMSPKSIPRLTKKLMDKGELFVNNRSDQGKVTQYIVTVQMPWDDLKEILQKGFKFNQANLTQTKKWFDKKRGPQVVPPLSCPPPKAMGTGVDTAMGTGVDIAMGTEPSLTVNEPSTLPANAEKRDLGNQHQADPDSISVFDYIGNITVEMYDLLYEMAKSRLVITEIRKEYSEYAHFFWVDSGLPVESIPLELAKEYGYKPEISGGPEVSDEQIIRKEMAEMADVGMAIAREAAKELDRQIISGLPEMSSGKVDAILREGGYDPDEVGKRMQAAADQALTKVAKEYGYNPEVPLAASTDLTPQQRDELLLLGSHPNVDTPINYPDDSCTCSSLAASGKMPPCSYCENLSSETSGPPENELDEITCAAFGPEPQVLADYAMLVAREAAEELDREIMSDDKDDLTGVFGPNPRQTEIDQHQDKPRLTKDELFLASMGANISQGVRYHISRIRDAGWRIRGNDAEEVEIALAEFLQATNFPIPTAKSQRSLWVKGIREQLAEDRFESRLGELYTKVWDDKKAAVREGKLTLTHPMAFTKMMYGIIQNERGLTERPNFQQLVDLMLKDKLIELKSVGDAVGYFYIDSGELVGENVPQKYAERYYR